MRGDGAKSKSMTMDDRTYKLLMSIRQAIIIALGAIEDFLGLERSIKPKRKRGTNGS